MLWIYLLGVLTITIIFLVLYLNNEKKHTMELKKIELIEAQMKKKKDDLINKRLKTIPCPVSNLNQPRNCYFDSNYTCSWNNETERCEKK